MNGDSDCDSAKTPKVTSGLNQNGGHVIVNPRSENIHVTDKNVKKNHIHIQFKGECNLY